MNPEDFPAPSDGFVITHFLVVSDQDRSREFYRSLFDGQVLIERDPVTVLLTTSPPSLSLRHPTPTAQARSSTFASPTLPRPTRNGRRRAQRSSLSRRTMDARSARISETPTAT